MFKQAKLPFRRTMLASKLGKLARHAANHDSLHLPPLSYSIFHGLISTHACRQQRDTRIHLSRRTAAAHGHGTPSSRTSRQPGQKPETRRPAAKRRCPLLVPSHLLYAVITESPCVLVPSHHPAEQLCHGLLRTGSLVALNLNPLCRINPTQYTVK